MQIVEQQLGPVMQGLPAKLKEMIARMDAEATDYPEREHHIGLICNRIAGGKLDYAEHWATEVVNRQTALRTIAQACGTPANGISALVLAAASQPSQAPMAAAVQSIPGVHSPQVEMPAPSTRPPRIASFDVPCIDDDGFKRSREAVMVDVNHRITLDKLDVVSIETVNETVFLGLGLREVGLRVWHRIHQSH